MKIMVVDLSLALVHFVFASCNNILKHIYDCVSS